MSDDIKRDKSPNCPRIALEDAIELIKKLHGKIGKASVKSEVAVGQQGLGYSGLNGASLGVIAALGSYGLIDKDRGGSIRISQLALQILYPPVGVSRRVLLRQAATSPKVFAALLESGIHSADEGVIAGQLVHQNFTPDTARKVASVFVKNVRFAELTATDETENKIESSPDDLNHDGAQTASTPDAPVSSVAMPVAPAVSKSNATGASANELPIPLDNGLVARVPYPMSEETYDLLMGTLQLWKKRLVLPSNQ